MNITWYKQWQIWLLFIFIQIPSLRSYYKYVPNEFSAFIPVIFIIILAVYLIYFNNRSIQNFLQPILISTKISWLIAMIMCVALFFGFQYELKLQSIGIALHGSDSSQALELIVQRILHWRYPYYAHTYFNNSISPGVGWGLLNILFACNKTYFLMIPFWLYVDFYLLYKITNSIYLANIFLLLNISCLSFWELSSSGIDLMAIGYAISAILLLLFNSDLNSKVIFWSALFVGMLATSRLVFFYLPVLIGFCLYQKDPRQAIKFTIIALVVMLLFSVPFYLYNPSMYQPLHLLGKGNRLMPLAYKISAVLACLIVACVICYQFFINKKRFLGLKQWLMLTWICLIVPLFFTAFGGLASWRHNDFATWEGANYIATVAPILITWFIAWWHDYVELG